MSAPRIWAFLGHRRGDNNQVLALAEELGLPFETRSLRYNLLRALEGDFLGPSLVSVERSARRHLAPPWPDLLIAIGRRSVPVARYVRRKSGGRTRLVLIGHPRVDPRDFDLVITTPQYPVPKHDNVLLLSTAMVRQRTAPRADEVERRWLDSLPRPHLMMSIGGSTKYHDLVPVELGDAARTLARRADDRGGRLIAVTSPRTESAVIAAVRGALKGTPHQVVDGNHPRFPVLLADADEHFVTGDSVSMISEAMLTGKPVGMIEVPLNDTGRKRLGSASNQPGRHRDVRRLWAHLRDQRLVGTLDKPIASSAGNSVEAAAAAVRAILDR